MREGSKELTMQLVGTNVCGNSFETQGVGRNAINRTGRRKTWGKC